MSKMRAFVFVLVVISFILDMFVAWCAHQNSDDPSNWINWNSFDAVAGGGIVIIAALVILVWMFGPTK